MNIPNTNLPRIVIIGGGFAGVSLIKSLKRAAFQIVLLDRNNYHTFQPLLYQVATAGLEDGVIAYPFRKLLQKHKDAYFRLANVQEISTSEKIITTDIGKLNYDYLVIATGSKTNFFDNQEMMQNSIAMKNINEALDIRSLILENFEQAVLTSDMLEQNSLMNIVLVGGGPTGVELAGALAEMKKAILPKDYPDLDISKMQIILVQSGDRILNTMSEESSKSAEKYLTDMGVTICKNTRVTSYNGKTVTTNTDTIFETATLIWTAGVKGAAVAGIHPKAIVSKSGRYKVNNYNQIEGFADVFAIGDVACMSTPATPQGHPMVVQTSIQQGHLLARNLAALIAYKPLTEFEYIDKGSMATIGRNKAVVDLPKFHFHGFFAWLTWIFVHLFALMGFKNRLVLLLNWMYNYIHLEREDRLIIKPFRKKTFTSFVSDEL
jgi:NADH:ubiquinone reductase (H+-translocating)